MHEFDLYEYAVVRLVPVVEREEFFNVGLLMLCKRKKFLRCEISLCSSKFNLMKSPLDYTEVELSLYNLRAIAMGEKQSSPIALLPAEERFRWLTSQRSSVIQTSRPHPGKSKNLEETFEKLFTELVR